MTWRLKGGGGGGATRALFAATQENLPLHVLTGEPEAIPKGPGSEPHEPEGAGGSEGAFELERVERETGGVLGRRGQLGRARTGKIVSARAGLLWPKTFSAELAAKGFEQCQADPCVFRRVLRGKVVVIIAVYVDDLLVASERSVARSAW